MNRSENTVSIQEIYPLMEEELAGGGSVSFTPKGRSMLPLIRGGRDRVTLSPAPKQLQKNDIVFYRRKNGDFILHRILRLENDVIFLCGDNQFQIEKLDRQNAILAIMTGLERKGKAIPLAGFSYRVYCALLPCRRWALRLRASLHRSLLHFFRKVD